MSGQQIGTVVGGIIGAFFGAPQLGMAIGGLIGGIIDPTVIEGPHIGDGASQSSAEGVPIPWILGTASANGNIVQKSGRREVKKEDNGKGGPVQVTYEAHQDYAIMICESSETRDSTMIGVQIVRCNGDIVYDLRPGKNFDAENAKFMQNVTFYNGDEDQLPDPTLEAITGVGNTPAYRGVYLAVFRDVNITQYGDAIPSYEWTMVSEGNSETISIDTLVHGVRAPFTDAHWPLSGEESRYDYTGHYETITGSGEYFTAATVEEIVDHFAGYYPLWGADPDVYLGYSFRKYDGSSQADAITASYDQILEQPSVIDRTDLTLLYNLSQPFDRSPLFGSELMDTVGEDGLFHGDAIGNNATRFVPPPNSATRGLKEYGSGLSYDAGATPALTITVSRPKAPPASVDPSWLAIPDAPGWYLTPDGDRVQALTYTETPGTYKTLSEAFASGPPHGQKFEYYEHGPILRTTDPNYSDEPYWTALYNVAVAEGTLPAGWTYSPDGIFSPGTPKFPIRISTAWISHQSRTELTSDPVSVATAISRICARGGVPAAQIDVTEVDQTLMGYPISSDYNAADCVRPLLSAYSLYGSEYDLKIHFRKRGDDVDVVFNPIDLVEGTDETDETVRGQSKEFPRKILLSYIDIDQDFSVRVQPWQTLSPDVRAIGEQSLQVNVVMDVDQAAQLVHIFGKRSRAAVEGTRKFAVPYATATDCYLQVVAGEPVGFDGKRYIVDKIMVEEGMLRFELAYDRQSAWTSDVSGIPALPPTPPASTLRGPTLFVVMNLPALIDAHDKLGVYIAACGLLDSWRGCLVQISRDGGATWTTILPSVTEASTIGSLVDAFPLAPASGTDVTNTLHVLAYGGELNSITETQLLNDGNPCAIVKSDATAEIIQFQTATEIGPGEYELTTISRGRLDTVPAAASPGRRFAALDSVYFAELTIADIGRDLLFRPVAFGTTPDTNPEYPLTFYPAMSQAECMPEYLTGTRAGDDMTVVVIPRHRFGTDINPVASVNFIGYRWTFTVGADSYTVDTGPGTATYTLTEAQQIITFGSAQASIGVAVSLINRITGAGPAQEETL